MYFNVLTVDGNGSFFKLLSLYLSEKSPHTDWLEGFPCPTLIILWTFSYDSIIQVV